MVKSIDNSKLVSTVQITSTEQTIQQKEADRVNAALNRPESPVVKAPKGINRNAVQDTLEHQPQPSFFASILTSFLSFLRRLLRIQNQPVFHPAPQVEIKQLNPQEQVRALGPEETKARLQTMIDFIDKNLSVEGIFRVSGNAEEIDALFEKLINPGTFKKIDAKSVHTVTVAMKRFIKACNLFGEKEAMKRFLDVGRGITRINEKFKSEEDGNKKQLISQSQRNSLHDPIGALSDEKYEILKMLMLFLDKVIAESETNKMDAHNLAVVFAPSLFEVEDPMEDLKTAPIRIATFEAMIKHRKELFPENGQGASLSTVQLP